MSRFALLSVLTTAAAVTACAPTLGPPPPHGPREVPFRAQDFAWSTAAGRGGIAGQLTYRQGPVRFTCANATVILTPETPWTRRRMQHLYGSTVAAAEPAEVVRARTPSAPEGDYSAFIRRTTCNAGSRFTFTGLPDGAWFAITIAKPVGGKGADVALMRRVTTQAGRTTTLTF